MFIRVTGVSIGRGVYDVFLLDIVRDTRQNLWTMIYRLQLFRLNHLNEITKYLVEKKRTYRSTTILSGVTFYFGP